MNNLRIEKYGQILEGDLKNWYIFIQDDAENSGGFLILLSASLNPADLRGFDDWVENFQDLKEYFQNKHWKIQWLEDRPILPNSYKKF